MTVWLTLAHAKCDDCEVVYDSRNAMGLIARHCKKTGHTASVTVDYGVDPK